MKRLLSFVLIFMIIIVLLPLTFGCKKATTEETATVETTVIETTAAETTAAATESTTSEKKYEGVELKLMVHAASAGEPALIKFAEDFYSRTGAKINIESVAWENIMQKLMASIQAGEGGYDFYYTNPEFAYTLWPDLLPLNDLMQKYNFDISDFLEPAKKMGVGLGDDPNLRYTLPAELVVAPVFYNKKMIPEFPKTWVDYDKALQSNTNPPKYGLAVAGVMVQTIKLFLARFWSSGDPLFTPDWKPLINNENGIKALTMLKNTMSNYSTPGVLAWDNPDAGAAFAAGDAAVYEGWMGNVVPLLIDPKENQIGADWDVTKYPENGTGNMTDNSFAIMKSCKNPDAAFEFISEFINKENAKIWAIEYGMASARQGIYDDPDVLAANPFFKGYSEALSVGKPFAFKVPQWIELFIPLGEGVSKYLSNETKDPKTALDEVAQKWTTSIEANKPSFEYKE